MSAPARRTPIQRLVNAAALCAEAQGEAQWTNGYRAAKGLLLASADASRLWEKEQAQWKELARRRATFRRLAQRLLREASR